MKPIIESVTETVEGGVRTLTAVVRDNRLRKAILQEVIAEPITIYVDPLGRHL